MVLRPMGLRLPMAVRWRWAAGRVVVVVGWWVAWGPPAWRGRVVRTLRGVVGCLRCGRLRRRVVLWWRRVSLIVCGGRLGPRAGRWRLGGCGRGPRGRLWRAMAAW